MIDLYYFPTPNTWKVSIMLEECDLPYRIVPVRINQGEQSAPEFRAISPNGRVPAIVDHDAQSEDQPVFESGAILLYLAEKTGRFLPASGPNRVAVLEWLFWQVGGLGPMAGQAGHFRRYAPQGNQYSVDRYTAEVGRLLGVLDGRLEGRPWIAGDDYSIADMACWGWVWFHPAHGQDMRNFPHLKRWFEAMSDRPAVVAAKKVGMDMVPEDARALYDGPVFQVDVAFAAESTRVKDAR